jgi:hypothetical protein
VDHKLGHQCEHLKSPEGWAAKYTLGFWKSAGQPCAWCGAPPTADGAWHEHCFRDGDADRVFPSQDEAKERNRELARHWLSLNDPDGRSFEEPG